MCEKKPICLLNFLKQALVDIRRKTVSYPTLGHVVTDIVKYFKIPVAVEEGIGPMGIGYIELKFGGFLDRHFKFQPYTERKCYKAYVKEMTGAAAEAALSTQTPGGPSQRVANETADPIDHALGNDEEHAHMDYPTLQSYHGISDAPSEQTPKWFVEYQKRQDEYQTRQEEFEKKVRYASRKARTDVRRRVKGRFVKAGDAYDYDPLIPTRSR
ncbi:zinc finger protein CONSTANS-LIKE 9 [Striga asiatica]|uniref:Zinc finger protein CONSTANS-LIKE 9 n=1 Tax=Striga asiatica TaxID=4170 RepID=A0A5A7QXP9_STRAF|nr:zinc finger protein CONSTANS-LIKE 9 [Striga asiatica]